jgi:CNT family concentrative nucleoside transporter
MNIARGILGVVVILALLWAVSLDRRRVNWRLIGGGLLLQLLLAAAFFTTDFTARLMQPLAQLFVDITEFSNAGARMVFGKLVDLAAMEKLFGSDSAFIFAFQVLPTIIFFSALTSVCYYLGILQRIVYAFAWVMKRVMRLSGAESLAAAGEVFLGQTESALLVKPYIGRMTRSEVATMMIGGMATIAGGVMAAYIARLGGDSDAERLKFAQWLLCASLMSAPGAIVAAKLLVPERDAIDENLHVPRGDAGSNFFDALASGTTQGLTLALNVAAMLIAFVAMAALVNGALGWIGARIPVGGGAALNDWVRDVSGGIFDKLSLQSVFGTLMAPLAWMAGVGGEDMLRAGQLLGTKLALNEFVAYDALAGMQSAGQIGERTVFLMTFALCGFANVGSIGIQLGGIGSLAPSQRATLAALGLRALLGGTLATLMTASVSGMFR